MVCMRCAIERFPKASPTIQQALIWFFKSADRVYCLPERRAVRKYQTMDAITAMPAAIMA